MELAHFRPHKRKTLKKTPGKSSSYPFHKPEENHPPGKDTAKKIPNVIGKAVKYAKSAKTKKVTFLFCSSWIKFLFSVSGTRCVALLKHVISH